MDIYSQLLPDYAHYYNEIVYPNHSLEQIEHVREYYSKTNVIRTVSVISIVFYYFCLILLSVNGLAKMVQPQLNGVFFNVLGSLRVTSPKFLSNVIGLDCAPIYPMGCYRP